MISYPEGLDFVWLASDSRGHLGAFITAGMGPVPIAALDNAIPSIEDIENSLCQLPQITQARLLVSVKRPDDFIDLAERGLFVYDWTDINRTKNHSINAYEPVALPDTPIDINALPTDLASLAKTICLSKIDFSEGNALDIRKHLNYAQAN